MAAVFLGNLFQHGKFIFRQDRLRDCRQLFLGYQYWTDWMNHLLVLFPQALKWLPQAFVHAITGVLGSRVDILKS